MSTSTQIQLSDFAADVIEGLSSRPKRIAPRYFYDDLGSALFEAITLLPEYGLSRADERLLARHAPHIATATGPLSVVAELGSGSGKKTKHILRAAASENENLLYCPIDVSRAALDACKRQLEDISTTLPVCGDWLKGLKQIASRKEDGKLLLLFLGSSIGNLDRGEIGEFLRGVRENLRPGDFFLLGMDLVKNRDIMLAAYDDPTGVTAAFNLNLLGRINRELDADFDLRSFAHEVRWNEDERRIEMHLLSCRNQDVYIGAAETAFHFDSGETLWTESSHKFTESDLSDFARSGDFNPIATWIDREWPFAEVLWQVP
ncbi:MAG: L-histidine N(alpha)-methyltransferase [Acidobacteriaceae bacterium]|nr:L-histidine N(alpha)-methyltransferase [Acidobacteriaceae bacterium]